MENKGRKIKIAKWLATNHKTGSTPSMDEIKDAMHMIEEIAVELFGKTTKEMTEEEANAFFNQCEKGTELKGKAAAA